MLQREAMKLRRIGWSINKGCTALNVEGLAEKASMPVVNGSNLNILRQ
jgi:hypothetical protein